MRLAINNFKEKEMFKKILIGLGIFFSIIIVIFFSFGFNDLLSPSEYANHELLRSDYERHN